MSKDRRPIRSRAPSLGAIMHSRSPSLGGARFSRSSSIGGSENTSPTSTPMKTRKCPFTDVRRARAIQRWQRIQQRVYSTSVSTTPCERRKAFQERRWFTISNPESYPYRFSVCPSEKSSMDVATEIAEKEGLLSKRERSQSGRWSSRTSQACTSKGGASPGRYMFKDSGIRDKI